MTAHDPTPLFARRKTLAEGGLCFGLTLTALTAAALGLQWLFGLLS